MMSGALCSRHVACVSRASTRAHPAGRGGCLLRRHLASISMRQNQRAMGIDLKQVHNAGTRAVMGKHPENVAHTLRIKEFASQGKWREAKAEFDSAIQKDTILYNITISAADMSRRYDEGLRLFAEMRASGMQMTSATYGAVLGILGRIGDHRQARDLWVEMRATGMERTPPCLTGLLNSAAAGGDVAAVEAHIADAVSEGWVLNSVQWGCLLKACRNSGDHARASEVLREMRERGVALTVVHFTLAMAACARAAEHERLDRAGAQGYTTSLEELMGACQIAPDPFFLEEKVRVLLGGTDLHDVVRHGLTGAEPPLVDAALSVLADARGRQIRLTQLLTSVEERLSTPGADRSGREQLPAAADRRPPGCIAVAGGRYLRPPVAAKTSRAPAPQQLPAGWRQVLDPASGLHYYWRESDPHGSTTWERPQ